MTNNIRKAITDKVSTETLNRDYALLQAGEPKRTMFADLEIEPVEVHGKTRYRLVDTVTGVIIGTFCCESCARKYLETLRFIDSMPIPGEDN